MRILLAATFLLFACATDNPRVFGGVKTELKNENQIVMSYMTEFEIGNILRNASTLAETHCKIFDKKSVMSAKSSSSEFTTVIFECVK